MGVEGNVSRDEFMAFRRELVDQMRDGFDRVQTGFGGVHARLDKLNGQVAKNSEARENLQARTRNLEREVFRDANYESGASRLSRRAVGRLLATADDDRPVLTRREWRVVWSVLAALATAIGTIAGLINLALERWG